MFKSRNAPAFISRTLLGLALAMLLALTAGCQREPSGPAAPAGPVETVQRWFQLLHDDEFNALAQLALPPDEHEALQVEWRQWASTAPASSDQDREQFAQMMADLTAEGAEQRLYALAEPSLLRLESELSAQLPLVVAMGTGFLSAGIQESPQLDADQKQHANEVIAALAGWLTTAPLADRDNARAAIAQIARSARALDLQQLDQARALSLEQILTRLGIVSSALKAVLATYGLDLDASLAGAKVELISQQGDLAQVRINYPLAASQLSYSQALVRQDDRWYSAQLLDSLGKRVKPVPATDPGAEPDSDLTPMPAQ